MGLYAEGTTVTVETSKSEIERTVRKYGATSFVSGYDEHRAFVLFQVNGRGVRFHVEVPSPDDPRFARTKGRQTRTAEQRVRAAQAEERRLWRCLLLAIKSKLEVIESGISTFDAEFLAHIMLPSGETVGEWVGPQIDSVYELGGMPNVLPALEAGS